MANCKITVPEARAIRALRKALSGIPETLRLYVTDSKVLVCKLGYPSSEVSINVGGTVNCGNVLTDMHDDFNNGRGTPGQ